MADEFDARRIRDEMDSAHAATKSHESEFLGLTEAEALALGHDLGIDLRLIRHDHTALHLDFRPCRMTLDLRTGVVTRAEAG